MLFTLLIALAGPVVVADRTKLNPAMLTKTDRQSDCHRKVQMVVDEDAGPPPMFRSGPSVEGEAVMLAAVDRRVDDCPVLVTLDNRTYQPIEQREPQTGLLPVPAK